MRRVVALMLVSASCCGALACGDDEPEMQVGFRVQNLECTRPGMLAYLQVTGVPGICPLEVLEDRTVSGSCRLVPTGAVRLFRLVYYVELSGQQLVLATVDESVDLRDETRRTVDLEFDPSRVVTDLDADADGRTNIEEFCAGTDPLVPD